MRKKGRWQPASVNCILRASSPLQEREGAQWRGSTVETELGSVQWWDLAKLSKPQQKVMSSDI